MSLPEPMIPPDQSHIKQNPLQLLEVDAPLLAAMKSCSQWVVWKNKRPYSPHDGSQAGWQKDPDFWSSFEEAFTACEETDEYQGVGFVFTQHDPLVFIDLDGCIKNDGSLEPLAQKVVRLANSYTEVSPSGTGLHIFGHGTLPHNKALKPAHSKFEVYSNGRFSTVTGDVLGEYRELGDIQKAIDFLLAEHNKLSVVKTTPSSKSITQNVSKGSRNNSLFKTAISLHHKGLDPNNILKKSVEVNSKFKPPLTQDEVKRVVSSAVKYARVGDIEEALTDHRVTEYVCATVGHNFLWLEDRKVWAVWDSTHNEWVLDVPTKVRAMVRHVCAEALPKHLKGSYSSFFEASDEKQLKAIKKQINAYKSNRKIGDVTKLLETESLLAAQSTDFDTPEYGEYVRVLNGFINLQSASLMSIDPSMKVTRRLGYARGFKGVSYVPTATCPNWDQFLLDIGCDDPEWVEYMQVLCGYFLIAGNPERKFFNFHGDGQNGKSTLLKVLQNIMGNCSSSERGFYFTLPMAYVYKQKYESNGEELCRGIKARLAVASESAEGKSLDDAKIKSLTGGDSMTLREMYVGTREATPDFSLVICTNHPLNFKGDDQAMVDRTVMVPFDYRVPDDKKNPNFVEELLLPEREGILAWMVEGAKKYLAQKCLPTCERITQATAEYVQDNNLPEIFLEDRIEKVTYPHRISTKQLYKAFIDWCDSEGHPTPGERSQAGKRAFNKAVERILGVTQVRGGRNQLFWENIQFIETDEQDGDYHFS